MQGFQPREPQGTRPQLLSCRRDRNLPELPRAGWFFPLSQWRSWLNSALLDIWRCHKDKNPGLETQNQPQPRGHGISEIPQGYQHPRDPQAGAAACVDTQKPPLRGDPPCSCCFRERIFTSNGVKFELEFNKSPCCRFLALHMCF